MLTIDKEELIKRLECSLAGSRELDVLIAAYVGYRNWFDGRELAVALADPDPQQRLNASLWEGIPSYSRNFDDSLMFLHNTFDRCSIEWHNSVDAKYTVRIENKKGEIVTYSGYTLPITACIAILDQMP